MVSFCSDRIRGQTPHPATASHEYRARMREGYGDRQAPPARWLTGWRKERVLQQRNPQPLGPDAIKDIGATLDRVSPTLCLAKWYKATIYLQTGETHSCYHPPPHRIPLETLAADPSGLHNTPQKKAERQQMMAGERPSGCQYCWNVEALGPGHISDRMLMSAYMFDASRLAEVSAGAAERHVNPAYLELSFENTCNFKCGYCHPMVSSRYMAEIARFGPYDRVESHRLDVDPAAVPRGESAYVAVFWRWWPTLKRDLRVLRLTGGEPLLHRSTWRMLDEIRDDPLPDLELSINTNLGVSARLLRRLTESVNALNDGGAVGQFKLYTSLDCWGPAAEYIRTGLDLAQWERNLHTFITECRSPVEIMCTFNALCVTRFRSLLEKVLEWRARYHDVIDHFPLTQDHKIKLETHYLTHPLQLDVNILPKSEFMPYIRDCLDFIAGHVDDGDARQFSTLEYEKFRRLAAYMETTNYPPERLARGRRDFGRWITEHDRRRGTDFRATFPEYRDFLGACLQSDN